MLNLKSLSLDKAMQRFEANQIRIGNRLMERQHARRTQNTVQRPQAARSIWHFSEDARQKGHIKMALRKGEVLAGITHRAADIVKTSALKLPLGLGKHLRL